MNLQYPTHNPFSTVGHIVKCDCGLPLLKKHGGGKFEILNRISGSSEKVFIKIAGSNETEITCGRCGRKKMFMTKTLSLPAGYMVVLPKGTAA